MPHDHAALLGTGGQGVPAGLVEVMGRAAGVERNGQDIAAGLKDLDKLEESCEGSTVRVIKTARAILLSAQMRRESRGSHFRTDYAGRDDANWLGNVFVRASEAGLEAEFKPLQPSGSSRSK